MKRTAQLLASFAFVLAGCNADTPVQADGHLSHGGGLMLSSLSQATNAQTLNALRRLTAPLHDLSAAEGAGTVFRLPPLTAATGASRARPMVGWAITTLAATISPTTRSVCSTRVPRLRPTNAPRKDGDARRRLAAFDYFHPLQPQGPGPSDPSFTRAPTLKDFPTMSDLPDIAFAPSRFGGWMFHISCGAQSGRDVHELEHRGSALRGSAF
jgi:hypothetical protein